MAKKTTRFISSLRVLAAGVALLTATCHDAGSKPSRQGAEQPKKGKTMTFDDAVAQLRTPARWCDAAAALVKLGDRRAIRPLYDVAALTEEGLPDRACVRKALEALGARDESRRLASSTKVDERRMAVTMLKWFPADENIAVLEDVAGKDPDPWLRGYAVGAILVQKVSPAWEAAMIRLLDASDLETRRTAVMALHHRFSPQVLPALKRRLAAEKDTGLRSNLEAAIRTQEERAKPR